MQTSTQEFSLDTRRLLTRINVTQEEVALLPETVNGIPVNGVAPRAFASCRGLKKVIIPASYAIIGERAFADCPDLEEVIWQGSFNESGVGVSDSTQGVIKFSNVMLNKLHLLQGFTFAIFAESTVIHTTNPQDKVVEDSAFANCVRLTRMVLNPNVVGLSVDALRGNGSLAELICFPKLQIFGEDCLKGCDTLERLAITTDNPLFGKNSLPTLPIDGSVGTISKLMFTKVLMVNARNSRLIKSKENVANRQSVAACIEAIRRGQYIDHMSYEEIARTTGVRKNPRDYTEEDFTDALTEEEIYAHYTRARQEEIALKMKRQAMAAENIKDATSATPPPVRSSLNELRL